MANLDEPKRRVAFVLVDGLGDISLPRLGYKTPLLVANVPNLDAIASAGINGLMDPIEVRLACGSGTAHLSLLGYDPRVYYRGRGAFESMGAGLAMSPRDIAFKAHYKSCQHAPPPSLSSPADSSGVLHHHHLLERRRRLPRKDPRRLPRGSQIARRDNEIILFWLSLVVHSLSWICYC